MNLKNLLIELGIFILIILLGYLGFTYLKNQAVKNAIQLERQNHRTDSLTLELRQTLDNYYKQRLTLDSAVDKLYLDVKISEQRTHGLLDKINTLNSKVDEISQEYFKLPDLTPLFVNPDSVYLPENTPDYVSH